MVSFWSARAQPREWSCLQEKDDQADEAMEERDFKAPGVELCVLLKLLFSSTAGRARL